MARSRPPVEKQRPEDCAPGDWIDEARLPEGFPVDRILAVIPLSPDDSLCVEGLWFRREERDGRRIWISVMDPDLV